MNTGHLIRLKPKTKRRKLQKKNHEELLVSLELERKMFQKELTLQETMSERVEVRKDLRKCERKIKELTEQLQKRNTRMETTATALKDLQEEVEKMDENDIRLKTIKELDDIKRKERVFDHLWDREEQQTVLGLLKGRKEKKKKDLGIRNHPESCMERMLSDEQVHGI